MHTFQQNSSHREKQKASYRAVNECSDFTTNIKYLHHVIPSVTYHHFSISSHVHADWETQAVGAVRLSAKAGNILRLHCTTDNDAAL